jgi:mannitol/fructose-specific phosphotransferase system IIA component
MSTALLEENYTLQTDIFSTLLARAEEVSKYLGEGIYQYIISQRKP